jgi:hypothetical protein
MSIGRKKTLNGTPKGTTKTTKSKNAHQQPKSQLPKPIVNYQINELTPLVSGCSEQSP